MSTDTNEIAEGHNPGDPSAPAVPRDVLESALAAERAEHEKTRQEVRAMEMAVKSAQLAEDLAQCKRERDRFQEDSQRQAETINRLAQAADDRTTVDLARHKLHEEDLYDLKRQLETAVAERDDMAIKVEHGDEALRLICLEISDGKWDPSDGEGTSAGEVVAAVKTERDSLIAERDDLTRRREVIQNFIPQTYGDAVLAKFPLPTEGHEWDNRTSEENAVWAIGALIKERDEARTECEDWSRTAGEIATERDALTARAYKDGWSDGVCSATNATNFHRVSESRLESDWQASETFKSIQPV